MTNPPPAPYQHNMRLLAQSDQGGRPDGVHVDVNGIVYATDFNAGLSVMEFLD